MRTLNVPSKKEDHLSTVSGWPNLLAFQTGLKPFPGRVFRILLHSLYLFEQQKAVPFEIFHYGGRMTKEATLIYTLGYRIPARF